MGFDSKIQCWGGDKGHGSHYGSLQKQLREIEKLDHVVDVLAFPEHVCAVLETKETICYGYGIALATEDLKGHELTSVATQEDLVVCGLMDNTTVKCWQSGRVVKKDIPRFFKPRLVDSSGAIACAVDQVGVFCWDWSWHIVSWPYEVLTDDSGYITGVIRK